MKVSIVDNSKKPLFSFPFPGKKERKKEGFVLKGSTAHTFEMPSTTVNTLLGPAPTGTGSITLEPTFGTFTL